MKKNAVISIKRRIAVFSGIVCLLAVGMVIGAKSKPHVFPPECVGCGDCVRMCPKTGEAIGLIRGKAVINLENCIACYRCVDVCSYGAVRR